MPNSQFDSAEREREGTIRLAGPIEGVSAGALVRLRIRVTQDTGFAAEAEQVLSGDDPAGFEVRVTPTGPEQLDPDSPLLATGVLICRAQGADTEEVFNWADRLDPEPAGGAASPAGWRRRDPPA